MSINMRKYAGGMSLMELMVAMAIVGILTAVAVPAYRDYVVRTNRAEAHWSLLKIASSQEQFYLQNNTYATDAQLTEAPPNGLGFADTTTTTGNYSLRIVEADAAGFRAEAVALEGQLEDDEKCEFLTVNDRGVRYGGPDIDDESTNDPACWGS